MCLICFHLSELKNSVIIYSPSSLLKPISFFPGTQNELFIAECLSALFHIMKVTLATAVSNTKLLYGFRRLEI